MSGCWKFKLTDKHTTKKLTNTLEFSKFDNFKIFNWSSIVITSCTTPLPHQSTFITSVGGGKWSVLCSKARLLETPLNNDHSSIEQWTIQFAKEFLQFSLKTSRCTSLLTGLCKLTYLCVKMVDMWYEAPVVANPIVYLMEEDPYRLTNSYK